MTGKLSDPGGSPTTGGEITPLELDDVESRWRMTTHKWSDLKKKALTSEQHRRAAEITKEIFKNVDTGRLAVLDDLITLVENYDLVKGMDVAAYRGMLLVHMYDVKQQIEEIYEDEDGES